MRMTGIKSMTFRAKTATYRRRNAVSSSMEQLVTDLQRDLDKVRQVKKVQMPLSDAQRQLQLLVSQFQYVVEHLQKRDVP